MRRSRVDIRYSRTANITDTPIYGKPSAILAFGNRSATHRTGLNPLRISHRLQDAWAAGGSAHTRPTHALQEQTFLRLPSPQ